MSEKVTVYFTADHAPEVIEAGAIVTTVDEGILSVSGFEMIDGVPDVVELLVCAAGTWRSFRSTGRADPAIVQAIRKQQEQQELARSVGVRRSRAN